MIEALDYNDDDFDRATIAAGVLGEMKATDAVAPLIAAVEKPLPIKSRANSTRIAAMRALVKIGDKRAIPTLMKILTTSADEQDFLLNQRAALALAEFRDPAGDPGPHQGALHDRSRDRHLPGVPAGAGADRRARPSTR